MPTPKVNSWLGWRNFTVNRWQARPCMNLFGMWRWFSVVPQGLDVLFPFVLLVIFGAFSWRFFWSHFEAFLFVIWWGVYAWALRGSFPFDSPPKSVSKGARFWGFRSSRVRGILGGISSIPLDLASFGGPNLGYEVPMRCSYYPQSLAEIRGVIRKIGSWIWGGWPAGVVHPELPRRDRSDWCSWPVWPVQGIVGFASGECSSEFPVVSCCYVSSLGQFGAR
jgi:hypothetical protein